MSQLFTLPSLELLLIAGRAVALLAGLLIFAWAFRHWRRASMRDTQRVFEQLDLVRSELLIMKEVMHHTTHRDGQRGGRETGRDLGLSATNRDTANSRVAAYDARLPMAATGGAVRGYEIAARMARNGAGKDELIRSCGITTHEAELLVKLHGHKQRDGANGAELIGRQPRTQERAVETAMTDRALNNAPSAPRQQTSAQVLQSQARQTAGAPRQGTAAPTTQRTPSAPVRNQGLPPRSRLVAVG
jgi:hypothetical protein